MPVVRDEATEIYQPHPEGPDQLLTVLTGDGGWAAEGVVFWAAQVPYEISVVELRVDMHPGLGEYGQLRRFVLAHAAPAIERLFTFGGRSIPKAYDECTEVYQELEDGTIPRKPAVRLLGDGSWAVPGTVVVGNRFGDVTSYMVVLTELEVDIHADRGSWGQLRRRTLITPVEGDEVLAELRPSHISIAAEEDRQ
jgi:hypothetical protein